MADGQVERGLALLDELGERPVSEHVEVFDAVHRALQDALASVEAQDAPDARRQGSA